MKPVKNVYAKVLALSLAVPLFFACSGKKDERDAEAAASALINTNKNIVSYGHLSVEDILEKADYKSIPMANAVIGGELASWQESLDLNKPVYFALQAPFQQDGTPDAAYGLVNVKDEKKLVDKLNLMGFATEKAGEITWFADGDVTVGVKNKLAIILSKKAPYDGKTAIEEAFKLTEGEESDGETKRILSAKADIVNGLNVDRMFATSNTSLNSLSAAKKDELAKLVADAQIKTEVHFDNGELRVESKNYFSGELKDRLFYKEDNAASGVKKLKGNAWMGMATNIDMRKLETFLNDFAPEYKTKLQSRLPGPAALALTMAGDNPFTQLFSGQFAMIATGKPAMFSPKLRDMIAASEYNFYLGSGTKGSMLGDLVEGGASMKGYPRTGEAFNVENKILLTPKADGIYGTSLNGTVAGPADIPSFAKKFGKNSFSMFVDFNRMQPQTLQLPPQARILEISESLVINADKDGAEMVFRMKNKSENVLRQIAQFYAKMAEERMSGISSPMAKM